MTSDLYTEPERPLALAVKTGESQAAAPYPYRIAGTRSRQLLLNLDCKARRQEPARRRSREGAS